MTLKPHQINAVQQAAPILRKKGLVYIFGQPRVGKSLIALELYKQNPPKAQGRCIVFTKKNAIADWAKYQEFYNFDVINYEQVTKCDPNAYNLVIIDEAHNFGAFPRPTQRISDFCRFCAGKPLIYLSGTPFVESPNAAYSQFCLSSYSPFRHFKNAYAYFKAHGTPDIAWISGKPIESYKKGVLPPIVNDYVVKVTYEDAGFKYQNKDIIHPLTSPTIHDILKGAADTHIVGDCVNEYPLDSISALMQFLHRACGGFYEGLTLPQEKLRWLLDFTQNSGKTAIMCYFRQEQEQIAQEFAQNPRVSVFSSTKYCEGIDLSDFDTYILYSFGYSGAKFIQLRDRIVNLNKNKPTQVHIPLIADTIDADIYERVSQKLNYNSSMLFKRYGGGY
jgi:hypothetical protein